MFVPTLKKENESIFFSSVQHFITVCNIVCANGGNICISIKYMITIWRMWLNSMFIYLLEFSLLFALGALRLGENCWVQQVLGQHHPPHYAVSISTWNRATSSLARWATSDTSVHEPGGEVLVYLVVIMRSKAYSLVWVKIETPYTVKFPCFFFCFFLDLKWWCSGPFLMKEKGVLIIAVCSTFCFSRFNETPDQYLFKKNNRYKECHSLLLFCRLFNRIYLILLIWLKMH